jgi:hypothetical protein
VDDRIDEALKYFWDYHFDDPNNVLELLNKSINSDSIDAELAAKLQQIKRL